MDFIVLNNRIWTDALDAIDIQLYHISNNFGLVGGAYDDPAASIILNQILINLGLWFLAQTIDAHQSIKFEFRIKNFHRI